MLCLVILVGGGGSESKVGRKCLGGVTATTVGTFGIRLFFGELLVVVTSPYNFSKS